MDNTALPNMGAQNMSQSSVATPTVGAVDHQQVADLQSKRTRCEVWTRVLGYHRPVSHFNIGKKAEHYSRKHFKECVAANAEFISDYFASLSQLA